MNNEIVPADKKLRARTVLVAVLLGLLALVALWVFRGTLTELDELADRDLDAVVAKMTRVAAVVSLVGGLGLVGLGGWCWWLGHRIYRSGRFPPPGMKVMTDTPIRTGAKARAMANGLMVVATVSVVSGTAGMWQFYRLTVTLLQP